MIRWNCPQCGERLETPESMGLDYIACAACGANQPVGGRVEMGSGSPGPNRSLDPNRLVLLHRREGGRRSLSSAIALIAWSIPAIVTTSIGAGFCLALLEASADGNLVLSVAALVFYVAAVASWVLLLGGVTRALLAASKML